MLSLWLTRGRLVCLKQSTSLCYLNRCLIPVQPKYVIFCSRATLPKLVWKKRKIAFLSCHRVIIYIYIKQICWSNDKTIIELGNRKLSWSVICLSLRLRKRIDLLASNKSQYFAQRRPIIIKFLLHYFCLAKYLSLAQF